MRPDSPSGGGADAKWLLATFLGAGAALNYADRAAMSAVLASVRTEFGASDVALGLLGSVFLWSYALGSPVAGRLADRGSRRGLVLWSIGLWSAVTALMGAAASFSTLIVLRFLLGLAECLFLPAAFALIAESHNPGTRARAMSFVSIGINAGMVLGGGFAGSMAEHYGWRSGFWALGLGGIALALAGRARVPMPLPRTPPAATPSFRTAVTFLASVRSYRVLMLESMLSGFGMWMFFGWLPLYLRESYGMTLGMAGLAGTFILQGAVVLGIATGGWFSDRVSAHAPHRRMLLYGVFYLLAAPFLLCFLTQPAFPLLAAAIAAFSFFRGLGQANDNPTQCEVVPRQFRATGLGVMNAVSTAAGGCGVLVAGLLKRELGLHAVFAAVAGIFALAGVALLVGHRLWMRGDIARAQQLERAGTLLELPPHAQRSDRRMQPLARPRRVLLAEQVAHSIEEEIAAGRWREWLPSERALQRVLNVSRQTVRAALERLQASQRIVVEPYRGYRIPPQKRRAPAAHPRLREVGVICSEPVYRMPPRFIQVLDIFRALCADAALGVTVLEGQRFKRTDPGRLMPRLVRTSPKSCWVLVLANRRVQEWFETSGVPAVVYGNVYSGLSLPGAGINYHACIRHATSLLLAKGHRRIAFVAYDAERAGEQDSVRGFREAFESHRGEPGVPIVIERPDSDADALCRQLDGVLRAAQRPTAFVVSHTHHYATVATHLASCGLRVPDDVSLICRSEDPFLQFMRPRPAFYRANMEVAAKLLFDRVCHAIEGTAKPGDQRLLVPELVAGGSVAAPPPNPDPRHQQRS